MPVRFFRLIAREWGRITAYVVAVVVFGWMALSLWLQSYQSNLFRQRMAEAVIELRDEVQKTRVTLEEFEQVEFRRLEKTVIAEASKNSQRITSYGNAVGSFLNRAATVLGIPPAPVPDPERPE